MDVSAIGQIAALRKMSVAELREQWLRSYGEPARSSNRDFLWRRLAYRVQEAAHGGLSQSAKDRLVEKGLIGEQLQTTRSGKLRVLRLTEVGRWLHDETQQEDPKAA